MSACPLTLAGGVERVSSPLSFIGVHQITRFYQKYEIRYETVYRTRHGHRVAHRQKVRHSIGARQVSTNLPKAYRRALLSYLKEMGTSPRLFDLMMEAKPADIRFVLPSEALDLHLTTRQADVTALLAAR